MPLRDPPLPLVEHIELQATLRPDAIAVHCGDQALTYHQLIAQSHRLAGRLWQCGAGSETLVGLFVGRYTSGRRFDPAVALCYVSQPTSATSPFVPQRRNELPGLHPVSSGSDREHF